MSLQVALQEGLRRAQNDYRLRVSFDANGQPMRWTCGLKEQVVAQIRRGAISAEEVKLTFGLSDEELASWQRRYDARGRAGLQVMKLQKWGRVSPAADRRSTKVGRKRRRG